MTVWCGARTSGQIFVIVYHEFILNFIYKATANVIFLPFYMNLYSSMTDSNNILLQSTGRPFDYICVANFYVVCRFLW